MNILSDTTNKAVNDIQILAIPDVCIQNSEFINVFSNEEALKRGTLFPELYLPFCGERSMK